MLFRSVDTPEEVEYALEMKKLRLGIVKTVPAYMKREEQLNQREAKKNEKDKEKDDGCASTGPENDPRVSVGTDALSACSWDRAGEQEAEGRRPEERPAVIRESRPRQRRQGHHSWCVAPLNSVHSAC